MVEKWGTKEFDFHSKTYVLPEDREDLENVMRNGDTPFIMKPPNWYCGIGIKMISDLGELDLIMMIDMDDYILLFQMKYQRRTVK